MMLFYCVVLDCTDEYGNKINDVILSNTRFSTEGTNICKISSLKTVPRESTMWTKIIIMDEYGNKKEISLQTY